MITTSATAPIHENVSALPLDREQPPVQPSESPSLPTTNLAAPPAIHENIFKKSSNHTARPGKPAHFTPDTTVITNEPAVYSALPAVVTRLRCDLPTPPSPQMTSPLGPPTRPNPISHIDPRLRQKILSIPNTAHMHTNDYVTRKLLTSADCAPAREASSLLFSTDASCSFVVCTPHPRHAQQCQCR